MLRKMLKYIISLYLVIAGANVFAQEVKIGIDSTKDWKEYIPTGIRVGTDVISLVKTYRKSDYQEYNFQADIDLYRYFLTFEMGQMKRTLTSTNGVYEVEGRHFSVGPDINFLHNDPDKSVLFFGLRYASSTFSDKLDYTYQNPFYGEGEVSVANNNINANWMEMVGGLKVRLWKPIWLGYTARFKFGVDTFEQNELIPNYIPGYGRAQESVTWGFNYYILLRIPVRKAPPEKVIESGS